MRSVALVLLVFALPAFATSPTLYASRNASPDFTITTDNDDSCDIGTAPAATLLLPYFEVETANRGIDTLFTITNVSHLTTIAHVTVWTDWGYPVLTFNVPLTGYDVQSFSMYDIVVRGIAGARSGEECTMPGQMPPATAAAIRDALVNGRSTSICDFKPVGTSNHRTATTAIGYVTIDETSKCSSTLPTDPSYFANEILFDNILTGDYQTVDNTDGSNYSGGNPLVHIRAVPEGGTSASKTNLPYTFYRRFSGANVDRRQP